MGDTAWRGAPPPTGGHAPTVYDVIGVGEGESLDLTILDERVMGVPSHWVIDPTSRRGRSRACEKYAGDCPWCQTKCREVWLGFVAAILHSRNLRVIFRMGPETAKALVRFADRLTGLRGRRFVFRGGSSAHRRAVFVDPSPLPPLAVVPNAHRLEHSLAVVFGLRELPEYRFSTEEIESQEAPT